MKHGLLANLGRALAACLLSALAASAQEAPAPPRPAPDKLVVQVVYKKGAKTAYQDVPGTAWYALFGSTPAMSRNARAAVEVSMHHVRTEPLNDLERSGKRFQVAPADNSFKGWLAGQRARFEGWLARL
jgi:hypothetical protein